MKLRIFLLVAIFLSSCATKPDKFSPIDSQGKTIAIISSIGPRIIVGTTGITVFENAKDVVEVPEWNLDSIATQSANAALSPRFAIIPATRNAMIVDSDTRLDKSVSTNYAISDAVRTKAHIESAVDLILIISLSNTAQNYTGRSTVDYGVGVSKWRDPFATRPPHVHTFLEMTILDGRNYNVISQSPLKIHSKTRTMFGGDESVPIDPIDDFEWKDHWVEMTAEQHEIIHQKISELLKEAIPFTIQKMGLK